MLIPTTVSRDVTTGTPLLIHSVVAGTYSAAPTLANQGFPIRCQGGHAYDAFEMTYSYDGTADATTIAIVRPWFYIPEHAPGGVPVWLSGRNMEDVQIPGSGTDVFAPVRRINSVPTGATQMYLQVVSIVGTAPLFLNMTVWGLVGMVANVDVGDVQVDIEASGISIGAVKLEDGATTDKASVRDANVPSTATSHVVVVQPVDGAGSVLKDNNATDDSTYSVGEGDFTAIYTAATQLTLAGIKFVPTVPQFIVVTKIDSTGIAKAYTPDTNAFNYAAGVLTITGATFAATDLGYEIKIRGPRKAYNLATDTKMGFRTNPESSTLQSATLAAVVDGADATYPYYVDCADMDFYAFQFILSCTAGTVTATIAGTLQDDGTAATACTYEDFTADFGGALIAAAGSAADVWVIDTPQPWRFIRIQIVAATGGNTGDWTIFFRGGYT